MLDGSLGRVSSANHRLGHVFAGATLPFGMLSYDTTLDAGSRKVRIAADGCTRYGEGCFRQYGG